MLPQTKRISGEIEISPEIEKEAKEISNISDFSKKMDVFFAQKVSDYTEFLLAGAILLDCSDIHIEPSESEAKLRIRIDGALQDVKIIPKEIYKPLLARLKLLSKLKLNISQKPQDGRFSILFEGLPIEVRTSSIPAEFGESIVMRILNPKTLIALADLGLKKELLEIFREEIKRPNGMIIITGPTGAGKTTTLYAVLKEIQNPEIKIITIEDPIEYHLEGISQTQVDPKKGYDFASGLRSIVRQDPDVILVGEIRDLETAQIAIQAAMTGHLVFTTLHTNDAPGTVARLQALGEKSINIAPALNLVTAQRLLRKICKKCGQKEKPNSEELAKIKRNIPEDILKNYEEILLPKAAKCDACNQTGYKGRVGIHEMFKVNDEMEKFIITSPSIVELKEKAKKNGMLSMYQDGLIKVLQGITTIDELERITAEN